MSKPEFENVKKLTEALRAIERIVGDSNSLDAHSCDLIRGEIASVFYSDINES